MTDNVALTTLDAQLKHMTAFDLAEAERRITREKERRREEETKRFNGSIELGAAPSMDKQPQSSYIMCVACASMNGEPKKPLRLAMCEDHMTLLGEKLEEFSEREQFLPDGGQ